MEITNEDLKRRMDDGDQIVLIDVRQPEEHEEYNIGGLLIPLSELPARLSELEEIKDQEIVVYCRSGMRSKSAQDFLMQMGYPSITNLTGGMLAWREKFGN